MDFRGLGVCNCSKFPKNYVICHFKRIFILNLNMMVKLKISYFQICETVLNGLLHKIDVHKIAA